ncbi:MAG: Ger(x)C family spore germination protein [Bacillota bacterium]|nr:Ger(x)C family spore germination protein [Bacillota bacterium]
MKKKQLLLILLILLVFLLNGCWDYTEYENMALVSVLGVDWDEQSAQITVSVQYIVPGGGTGGGGEGGGKTKKSSPDVEIKAASGSTIDEALTKIQQIVGRRLFYGYLEAEIIGEEAAKNIIEDIIGMNDRTPEIRTTAYILIASGKASETVGTVETDIAVSGGRHIRDLVDASNMTGNAYPVIIEDFIENLQKEGIEATAPRIITTVSKNGEGKGQSDGSADGSSGSGGKAEQKEGCHRIDGMAVFKRAKFAGWLDGEESKGLIWITGKNINPYETFKTSGNADTSNTLIFRITKSKGKIKVKLDNGTPIVNISVYVEADLRKYAKDMKPRILTPDAVNIMQDDMEIKIRSEIDAAVKKCQKELKSDVLGFGQTFYRQHLSLWRNTYEKEWESFFPDLPVEVKVQAKVVTTGTSIMRFFTK